MPTPGVLGSGAEGSDPATTSAGPSSPPPPLYDVGALRAAEFPHLDGWTNLDNAASAPTPARAVNCIRQVLDERIAVSQWLGRSAFELLTDFSKAAAVLINAAAQDEIVFVEGCSLGLNLIAQALKLEQGDNI